MSGEWDELHQVARRNLGIELVEEGLDSLQDQVDKLGDAFYTDLTEIEDRVSELERKVEGFVPRASVEAAHKAAGLHFDEAERLRKENEELRASRAAAWSDISKTLKENEELKASVRWFKGEYERLGDEVTRLNGWNLNQRNIIGNQRVDIESLREDLAHHRNRAEDLQHWNDVQQTRLGEIRKILGEVKPTFNGMFVPGGGYDRIENALNGASTS